MLKSLWLAVKHIWGHVGLSPRVVHVRMRVWQVEMGGDVRVVCGGHARVRFHVFGWLYVS